MQFAILTYHNRDLLVYYEKGILGNDGEVNQVYTISSNAPKWVNTVYKSHKEQYKDLPLNKFEADSLDDALNIYFVLRGS